MAEREQKTCNRGSHEKSPCWLASMSIWHGFMCSGLFRTFLRQNDVIDVGRLRIEAARRRPLVSTTPAHFTVPPKKISCDHLTSLCSWHFSILYVIIVLQLHVVRFCEEPLKTFLKTPLCWGFNQFQLKQNKTLQLFSSPNCSSCLVNTTNKIPSCVTNGNGAEAICPLPMSWTTPRRSAPRCWRIHWSDRARNETDGCFGPQKKTAKRKSCWMTLESWDYLFGWLGFFLCFFLVMFW